MNTNHNFRWPAEWESQDAVLLAWPHDGTDWVANLEAVEETYIALVAAITPVEIVVIIVPNIVCVTRVTRQLKHHGDVLFDHVRFVVADYNDTWLRDTGPIIAFQNEQPILMDFQFTGWGGKFASQLDDLLVQQLIKQELFISHVHQRMDWALEGGAVEHDGKGTVMSTYRCLRQRHPEMSKETLCKQLQTFFQAEQVLILDNGYLEGDDTDAHIDTLARFVSPVHIVYQSCDNPDDSHFSELEAMANELAAFKTQENEHYKLTALPFVQPIYHSDGRRLSASYANFLIINERVLMPRYDDDADELALKIMQQIFPDRLVVSIPCRSLIEQNGSLHCITMQIPKGALNHGRN